MEAIRHSLSHNNNLSSLLSQTTQGGLNPQSGVYTKTKAKMELEITTAEGDRVTLFSQSKVLTAYATYDSRGRSTEADPSGSTDMYHVISTNKVAITVEGNLNEAELADIQHLLQAVEDIFTNSLTKGGNPEGNAASSLSLDSMKTLSSFDAELKYSQKINAFGMVSGSTAQIPVPTTSGKSPATETGLVSETTPETPSDLTTMTLFKARIQASLHLSGTRLVLEEPAQNLLEPAPAVPGTPQEPITPAQTSADATSTPVSTEGTATQNQAADTSATTPGALSSFSTYRMKLVEEFAAFVQRSTIDSNRMAPIFSQFIPRLIAQLNNNYPMDENQRGVIHQTGNEILNTFQNAALAYI